MPAAVFNLRKWFFSLQYAFADPPWDTGESPPELFDFMQRHSPGKALDLGCGTGTNGITLARGGWVVTGVDFVGQAVRKARRKARRAGVAGQTRFIKGNVLDLEELTGPFQLILDIGCFHVFGGGEVVQYRSQVETLLADGGSLLLYVHLREPESEGHGASEAELQQLGETLDLVWREDGTEGERPSAWLEFQKR